MPATLDPVRGTQMSAGYAMLADMMIRAAKAEDWPAIWPILKEVGTAGETLTWDPARTEARARSGWMRELPGRTIVAVDDDGNLIGSANTHPIHPGPTALNFQDLCLLVSGSPAVGDEWATG